VKEQASKLADQGCVSLAIDLHHDRGKVATTPDMAHEIVRSVPEDRAKRDLHAAVEFLKSQPSLSKDRLGAIGWCVGGGYALDLARQEPDLAALVINYGHLATEAETLKKANASTLCQFGPQDRGITPDDVKRFGADRGSIGEKGRGKDQRSTMTPATLSKIPKTKDGYRAAADAWSRTADFLVMTVKK
jgi:carboxymethylenebutenolidase